MLLHNGGKFYKTTWHQFLEDTNIQNNRGSKTYAE